MRLLVVSSLGLSLVVIYACGGRSSADLGDYEDDYLATSGAGGAVVSNGAGTGGMSTGGMSTDSVVTSGVGPSTTTGTGGVGGMASSSGATMTTGGGMTSSSGASMTTGGGGMTGASAGPSTAVTSASSTSSGGGAISCITCTFQNCPSAAKCLQSETCLQGASCAMQKCWSNGQPDVICAIACFNGDIGAAADALAAVTCVLNQCASECQGAFGP